MKRYLLSAGVHWHAVVEKRAGRSRVHFRGVWKKNVNDPKKKVIDLVLLE